MPRNDSLSYNLSRNDSLSYYLQIHQCDLSGKVQYKDQYKLKCTRRLTICVNNCELFKNYQCICMHFSELNMIKIVRGFIKMYAYVCIFNHKCKELGGGVHFFILILLIFKIWYLKNLNAGSRRAADQPL